MIINPISSGSSGNCYSTKSGNHSILIELGIPWKKILPAIDFKASSLDFALVSHFHLDHSKSVKDALKAGVDVGMSIESAEALGVQGHHRVIILKPLEQRQINSWTVLPFPAVHDVPCFSFVVAHGDNRLLYLTDSAYSKHRFSGLTHIMVECNHIEEILSRNILNGSLPPAVGHRIRRTHMGLDTLIEMLKANDLSRCREIVLIHLSSGNSCEAEMIRKVQSETGIPTRAA